MSDININQVLAQMRALSAAASGSTERPDEGTSGADFAQLMKNSLDDVNAAQAKSRELATAFEMGEKGVELPEVMVALQKASISFQAITQVRNKLLSAYQDVMNMQV
ncbi:MAG: flagellar hook-basal body complex protein FliE [Gammaproteobacteria bacterium]|jgi:flagellar hook-basal body complex protein FliE|nr:flagellar hook-basal body complex protein FliE [Gammaproteobacteria bacterium]